MILKDLRAWLTAWINRLLDRVLGINDRESYDRAIGLVEEESYQ